MSNKRIAQEQSRSIGRFDRMVWGVVILLLAAIAVVIWWGDRLGLQILARTPLPAAQGVSTQTQIRIRFDQELRPETAGAELLRLQPPVSGTVRIAGDSLVFDPDSELTPNTTYRVVLAPGLRSVQGRELQDRVELEFTTGETSIIYSIVDDNKREQLMHAAVRLAAANGSAPRLVAPQQLTDAPYGIWDFAADPHSGRVVFSMLNEDGTSDLWTVQPGAGEPALLYACPDAACSSVAFAPERPLMAFSRRNASGFSAPVVSPPRLWLLDLEMETADQIFADEPQLGFDPRWSPDGEWLTYVSPDLGGIGAYNLEDGTQRFYPTATGESAPWHPQDNRFVMSEMLTDGEQVEVHLFVVDPVTEERRDLSGHEVPVEDNSPAWSPDGERLAWRRKELSGARESLGQQLWIMQADGSQARPLTSAPEYDHGAPRWSPEGRYLLYHRFPLRGPEISISIWLMDVQTGEEWELVDPGQRPLWTP